MKPTGLVHKNGFATVEFVMIMPVFILLLSILVMFGSLSKEQLQMQYDNYAAAKYASETPKLDDLSNPVTESNCRDNAGKLLSSRKYDSIECNISDNILELTLTKNYQFAKIPLLEGVATRTLTSTSYTFVY